LALRWAKARKPATSAAFQGVPVCNLKPGACT
jgi:hypothetical protein